MSLGERLKEVEGGRIKIVKKGEIWLRGIFPRCSVAPPTVRLYPTLHVPSGVGCRHSSGGLPLEGGGASREGWTDAQPLPSPDRRATHSSSSSLCRSANLQSFPAVSLRRLLLLGSLGASALRHDVGNLRQWAPRRDFIRFWRYVDCNVQWLYGAPSVANKTLNEIVAAGDLTFEVQTILATNFVLYN